MEWKGPREWAIERDSVKNKKKYTKKWGYDLEIVDMSTKKRYAHEWRESWEKVDSIKNAMRKYPHAEWCVCYELYPGQANKSIGSGGWTRTHLLWSRPTPCRITSSNAYNKSLTAT